MICDYCKIHGHTREIYYKLVGYPSDWKIKNKSRPNSAIGNTGRGIENHAYADTSNAFGPMTTNDKQKRQGNFGLMTSSLYSNELQKETLRMLFTQPTFTSI